MREIKIITHELRTSDGKIIFCPMSSHPKSDGLCTIFCAWFRIEQEPAVHGKQSNAYCGDKLIGEIVP